MVRGLRAGLAALLMLLVVSPIARAEHAVSFDLYAFSQEDDGGQEARAEGFDHAGARVAATLEITASRRVELTAALGWIENDPRRPLPATVWNATIAAASAEIVTLDASVALALDLPSGWTVTPGLYYHHQYGYIVGGGDLEAERELRGGDVVVQLGYGLRIARPLLDYWDGTGRGHSHLVTHNLRGGLTQVLGPSLVVSLGLQLTGQVGFQADPYGFVLAGPGGVPVDVRDERLPRMRRRAQLSSRIRYSPLLGASVGLDASGYADDWGVRHAAVEPSVTVPLGGGVRARTWARRATQRESRFHLELLDRGRTHRTSDADLGGFVLTSAGLAVTFPPDHLAGIDWTTRVTVFGFRRDDGIDGVGLDVGLGATW